MKKLHFNFKINRLIRYFLISDFIVLAAWGLISPIFSIFVIEEVKGATLVTVGAVVGMYFIVKSILQIPIGEWLDESEEKMGFYAIMAGLAISGVSAIGFVFVETIWQLYVVQFFHAIGFAIYIPAWLGSFSKHIDKGRDSFEWALQSTTAGLAYGAMSLAGGTIAFWFGYSSVFISAGVLSFFAIAVMFFAPDIVFPKPKTENILLRDHTPRGSI